MKNITQAEAYSDIKKVMFASGTPFPRHTIPMFAGCHCETATNPLGGDLPIRIFADGSVYTEVNHKGKRMLLSFVSRQQFEREIGTFLV
jgi:hypothetical protein